jgi:hypothetical protein
MRRTTRRDKSQVEVKSMIEVQVKVKENLEFLVLMAFIGFVVSIE